MKIFDMKIYPSVTYLMEVMSPTFSLRHLLELDKIKACFVKKALRLHRTASSTFALELIGTTTLTEDLRSRGFRFSETVYQEYKEQREGKLLELCSKQYHRAPAVEDQRWKAANQRNRHLLTRSSIHDFHHKMCQYQSCYTPDLDCVCLFCDATFDQEQDPYHITVCAASISSPSLTSFIQVISDL